MSYQILKYTGKGRQEAPSLEEDVHRRILKNPSFLNTRLKSVFLSAPLIQGGHRHVRNRRLYWTK